MCKSAVSNPTSTIAHGASKQGKGDGSMSSGSQSALITLFDIGMVSLLVTMMLA